VDEAFEIGRAAGGIDRRAVEAEFHDVARRHEFRAARAGQQEAVGPFGVADADMAEGIDHALAGENVIGVHQLGDCRVNGHCEPPLLVTLLSWPPASYSALTWLRPILRAAPQHRRRGKTVTYRGHLTSVTNL